MYLPIRLWHRYGMMLKDRRLPRLAIGLLLTELRPHLVKFAPQHVIFSASGSNHLF